jgi:purine-nucleoside phosphorylase
LRPSSQYLTDEIRLPGSSSDRYPVCIVARKATLPGSSSDRYPVCIVAALGSRSVTGPADPDTLARRAAQLIAEGTGIAEHDVAIVLGSGWAPAVAALGSATAVLTMAELPGFTPPTAVGHTGQVLSIGIGGHRTLVLAGRVHAYEGLDLLHVVHPVRAACAAGARVVVLTNAAGAVREDFDVGQPVLISDHLNLTARSPLIGAQFVDMVGAYAPRLRALAREVDPTLAEGVYAGLPGPQFETPSEIRMLRKLGADLVGMSTVHETIAARAAGAEVLGVSLVTNLAAGIIGEPLSHVEVLAAGAASASRIGTLLADVVARL